MIALAAIPARAQWSYLGPPSTAYHSDFTESGGVLLMGIDKTSAPVDLYRSTDGGLTWETAFNSGSVRAITPLADGFLLQVGGKESYRGNASGTTWNKVADPGYNVTRYFYDRTNSRLYAVTQRGALLASTDEGESWTSLGVSSQDLTFVHARGDVIITGYNGTFGAAHLSTDGGQTWTSVSSTATGTPSGGLVASDGSIYLQTTTGFFPSSSTLWRSRDNGATWTNLTEGTADLGGISLLMQSVIHAEGPTILFNANNKIVVSTDDGASWSARNEGVLASSNGSVTQLAIRDGYVYALFQAYVEPGTNFGLYRRPLSELGFVPASVEAEQRAAASLKITPNPARGAASVTLSLDRAEEARISIHDPLGRQVALLHQGRLAAGTHVFTWDGDFPAGLYMVSVQTAGRLVTRPLLRDE